MNSLIKMPEIHNNEDIRVGFLYDYETRIWVNCNWVLDYIENLDEAYWCERVVKKRCADYKTQVGIFQYLTNNEQYRFWKDFNYNLQNDDRFRLPNYYEDEYLPNDSTLEAIRDVWKEEYIELEEDEYMDNCWNKAKVKYNDK